MIKVKQLRCFVKTKKEPSGEDGYQKPTIMKISRIFIPGVWDIRELNLPLNSIANI